MSIAQLNVHKLQQNVPSPLQQIAASRMSCNNNKTMTASYSAQIFIRCCTKTLMKKNSVPD